ncbi:hypothetical protein FXO38_31771 [Capsicum annuum]|uniref:Ubiquitin-like protease family profile domain-containing protein n=1 Tax=Capsicum annuum TaxID=4072 RepID=A0A2G2YDE7_CAPAN|nr:hypothetical protein FXO38_31771 [Capsicum annuum]PHT67729.1 hypothetical protein T459_27216 [Capsicum annuum]
MRTSLKSELSEIKILLLGKLKADGDILFNKKSDNLQGEPSRDPMVDDQYDDPHRPTENEKSARKNVGVKYLLLFSLVEEFSKSSLYSELQHLDTIFYYIRMKTKYEPNIVVKFTTIDFVFRNKIDALYQDFLKIFMSCRRNKRLRNISEASIVLQMYRGTRSSDKVIQKVMLPYQTLIPYFLQKVNFYLEKGIDKFKTDTLPINMVDDFSQETQCDCGAFVCAFVEYVIHGRDIPKEIDIGYIHMRTFVSRDFVIKSFMLPRTIHDVVLPTGRIYPWYVCSPDCLENQ